MSDLSNDIEELEAFAASIAFTEADEVEEKGDGYKKKGMTDMLFESEDEAKEMAEKLGCQGTHTSDGKYMPCANHEDLVEVMDAMEGETNGANTTEGSETKDDEEATDEIAEETIEDEVEEKSEGAESEDTEEKTEEEGGEEVSTTSLLDQMSVEEVDEKNVDTATTPDILEQMMSEEEVSNGSVTSDMTEVKYDESEDENEEKFMCGISRKKVSSMCKDCRGGCAPSEDMPGLKKIEEKVLELSPEGSEIIASGYSPHDDVYVINVKGGDGKNREVFRGGDGSELGYLVVSAEGEYDETRVKVIDKNQAADIALTEVKGGEIIAVDADQDFFGSPTYAVEIESGTKSYDVYVAIDGEVLGFTEYATEEIDPEVKELEAELELKRMYSREQRMELAESGEAMEDGSFPIVDQADLRNAIQAFGRASDPDAARAHIMKRAEALDAVDLIPEKWMSEENAEEQTAPEKESPDAATPKRANTTAKQKDDEGKAEVKEDGFLADLAEFRDLFGE